MSLILAYIHRSNITVTLNVFILDYFFCVKIWLTTRYLSINCLYTTQLAYFDEISGTGSFSGGKFAVGNFTTRNISARNFLRGEFLQLQFFAHLEFCREFNTSPNFQISRYRKPSIFVSILKYVKLVCSSFIYLLDKMVFHMKILDLKKMLFLKDLKRHWFSSPYS